MQLLKISSAFKFLDSAEKSLCIFCNRAIDWRVVRLFFVAISRLGNGMFWYSLAMLLAVYSFPRGLQAAAHMIAVGIVCVTLYKLLKNNMLRQRPYISWEQLKSGTAPLDLYSFPSGHTLHAVAFSMIACNYFPILAWILVPFTTLIALSRVVLGLHYPTDVLVGAIIGYLIAIASTSIIPI